MYEPLNEDACAGLAAAIALFGGRSLVALLRELRHQRLADLQTVSQAMAELRRRTPSQVNMFTAGALEQGRNGWTHQRPEIESYCAAMMRNGNDYPLFPCDANMIQAAYAWALGTHNKFIAIFASKTALPVRTTPRRRGAPSRTVRSPCTKPKAATVRWWCWRSPATWCCCPPSARAMRWNWPVSGCVS